GKPTPEFESLLLRYNNKYIRQATDLTESAAFFQLISISLFLIKTGIFLKNAIFGPLFALL
ncbi:hypothetical protein RCG42_07800, partial [Lactobacillus delbrueckii subsp. lactis]|uniref:hypothetical protein n=1 Tax=Lactobacillus delbrueckii TaxID=1584 RepID=UPI0027E758DB